MLVDDRPNDLPFLIALGGAWIGGPCPDWARATELLSVLGIADATEIDRWAKFASAEDPLAKSASAQTREQVIARLKVVLRELGKTAERNDDDMRRFHGLVYEARVLNLVDEDEVGSWWDDFIVRDALPTEPEGTFSISIGGSETVLGKIERAVAPPRARKRGLRIDAVEIYEGGLVLRWQHIRPERSYSGKLNWPTDEIDPQLSPHPHQFEVSDDRGTDFSFGTGGAQGSRLDDGSARSYGTSIYEVRPAADAQWLYVDAGESRFEIDLSDARE